MDQVITSMPTDFLKTSQTHEYDDRFEEDAETKAMLDRLLRASLEQVPVHGWSHEAVEQACKNESLPIGLKTLLMPNGPHDLITRFYAKATADL
ncbi:hypothetical protein Ciccas_009064, partial [Cichlidogyrus casuarinus]